MYEPRSYRQWVTRNDLVSFQVTVRETDLLVAAKSDLSGSALDLVHQCRSDIEAYIEGHPDFASSLEPLPPDHDAPPIVQGMMLAAEVAGVGPMAAVAGALAERVGTGLLALSDEVIVENGGDIYLKTNTRRMVGVYAGDSPITGRLAMAIEATETPLGICTSSGSVGHSLSFGSADAVVAMSTSTALADAAATAIANRVRCPEDISSAIGFAQSIVGLTGVLVVKGEHLGVWGRVRLADSGQPES